MAQSNRTSVLPLTQSERRAPRRALRPRFGADKSAIVAPEQMEFSVAPQVPHWSKAKLTLLCRCGSAVFAARKLHLQSLCAVAHRIIEAKKTLGASRPFYAGRRSAKYKVTAADCQSHQDLGDCGGHIDKSSRIIARRRSRNSLMVTLLPGPSCIRRLGGHWAGRMSNGRHNGTGLTNRRNPLLAVIEAARAPLPRFCLTNCKLAPLAKTEAESWCCDKKAW